MKTAERMKDWESLRIATEEMIQWQEQIVGWWDVHVSPGESPGRRRKESVPVLRPIPVEDAEKHLLVTKQQVSRWRNWLKQEEVYGARVYDAAYKKAMADGDSHYRTEGTGQNEWFTPARYIEAAREVMGSIDLDPASCAEAQTIVKAEAFLTKDDDALTREWGGPHVFLNPPFSRDLMAPFAYKLLAELKAGRTKQAILLTHNNTDTEWFHALATSLWLPTLCFTHGRIAFYRGDEPPPGIANGQVFFYFGPKPAAFADTFAAFGLILVPYAA
jgi:hypothetical protein